MSGRQKSPLERTAALSARESTVFSLLERAARAGDVCPSNDVIAGAIGSGIALASTIVSALERKGLIAVERGNSARVVTIAANGCRTAGTVSAPHWRLRTKRPGRSRKTREFSQTDISDHRERSQSPIVHSALGCPCLKCGARSDACSCAKGVVSLYA